MPVKTRSFVIGTYTAINITKKEAALNGVVARIHVTRLSDEVMDLKLKRGLKRKRGGVKDEMKSNKQQQVPATRSGRSRKFNFEPRIARDTRINIGGKHLRDRKPKASTRVQEKSTAIVKSKQKAIPAKVARANVSSAGDEVISFLPVFNNKPKSPAVPYNKKKYPTFTNNEILSPGNPVVILGSDFSSVIHGKSKKASMPSPNRDAPVTTANVTKPEGKSKKASMPSPKRDAPVTTANVTKPETVTPQNEIESKENKKIVTQKCKSNGSLADKKSEKVYALFVSDDTINKHTESSTVGEIDFNKLVRSLKQVKLPGPKWKIRIVVSKVQTITEVTFTNKEEYERCIKFSRVFTGYMITFDKVHIKLFGAPTKITTFNDVTILLDIIHNISLNDVLLDYQSDVKL